MTMTKRTTSTKLGASALGATLLASVPVMTHAQTAAPLPLSPYQAEYVILQGKKTVGKGTRALRQLADGRYQLSQQSDIKVLFYKDRRQEWASFSKLGDRIQPEQYRYRQDTTFKDREVDINFAPPGSNGNGQPGRIHGKRTEGPINLAWQSDLLDPLSYQQQMAFDLSAGRTELDYHFVKDNGTRRYAFKVVGPERVTTPYGTINALRVDRIKMGSKEQTRFWLWPEREYLLVRLSQLKNGKPFVELQLKNLSGEMTAGL